MVISMQHGKRSDLCCAQLAVVVSAPRPWPVPPGHGILCGLHHAMSKLIGQLCVPGYSADLFSSMLAQSLSVQYFLKSVFQN